MERTVLISITVDELQTIIIDCVNTCLKYLPNKSGSVVEVEEPLSIQEAASFINLAVPTIYGLVSQENIPHFKKGKKLYFSKQDLTDWIKSGRRKTHAQIVQEAENYISSKTQKKR